MRKEIEFFARQLNTDPSILEKAVSALEHITDKKAVVEELYEEVQSKNEEMIDHLKLSSPTVEELFSALENNIAAVDKEIFEALEKPICNTSEGCSQLISKVMEFHGKNQGFFLKKEVAENLLAENPPQHILSELGYSSVPEMLAKEDLFEVYAALRFLEEREWLNTHYITAYRKLTKEDFEERPIQIRVLPAEKWQKVTAAFLKKKLHPMSHLKELGIIFVIPGEEIHKILTSYLFGMASHYLDEVTLYANYFKYYSESADFGDKIVSAIRGDVPEISVVGDPNRWLVIQRYLFKENPTDPRLGVPHINPEALYHQGASRAIAKMEDILPSLSVHFDESTNYVAGTFPGKNGEQLINYNFMDIAMSLMNKLPFEERYQYHFHEALWNRIFTGFFGEEKLKEAVIKHLLQGWFDIRKL